MPCATYHSNIGPIYNHWPHPSRQKPQQTASPPPQPSHARQAPSLSRSLHYQSIVGTPSASPFTVNLIHYLFRWPLTQPLSCTHYSPTQSTVYTPQPDHKHVPGRLSQHSSTTTPPPPLETTSTTFLEPFLKRQDRMVARFPRRATSCGKHTTTPLHRATPRRHRPHLRRLGRLPPTHPCEVE